MTTTAFPWELIVAALNRSGLVEPVSHAFPIRVPPATTIQIVLDTKGKVFLPYFAKLVCEPSGLLDVILSADGNVVYAVEGCDSEMFRDPIDFARIGFPWVAKQNMTLTIVNTSTTEEGYVSFLYGGGLMSPDAYRLICERLWGRVREWLLYGK